jgi:hypothetical protein
MKRLRIVLILGLVAAVTCAASSQPLPNPAQQSPPSSAPTQELPKSYIPGLGEFMGRIQTDHAKLWLAGQARNWELAGYQLTELKEVFSDVQDLIPRYQNIPVGDMIDALITGTIADMEGAIAARDFSKFSTSFDELTAACNSCHQAANRPYIAIRRPTRSNFSNQDFLPAKK